VSPHNILIGTDGSIKLVDFGVAKAMGRLSDVTSAGQLKGKFGYMSPEQATARPVDRRSDLFSLGIVLFELTT
jgi:eukaryotic-like serine/threonine-protein kinase